MRSIIDAFHPDEFRRVKVGVRRTASGSPAGDTILAQFSAAEQRVVRGAYGEAIRRLEVLLAEHSKAARGTP